jgi:hypothetical protein
MFWEKNNPKLHSGPFDIAEINYCIILSLLSISSQ